MRVRLAAASIVVFAALAGLPGATTVTGAAGPWTPTVPPLGSQAGHRAVPLPGGGVLLVGGFKTRERPRLIQRYDPTTNAWQMVVAATCSCLYGHTATALADGQVLVTGGSSGFISSSFAVRYDPVVDRWSDAGAMSAQRSDHTATLLPGGQVLVAGGINDTSSPRKEQYATTERYDPSTDRWTPAASLPGPRFGHRAVPVPGGVLLVGGGRPRR